MGRNKKQEKWFAVCVKIPDYKIWQDFLSYVKEKEGKIKGILGVYISNALESYIVTNRKEKPGRARTPNFLILSEVVETTIQAYLKADKKINIEKIYDIIRAETGLTDIRAIRNKYKQLLIDGVFSEKNITTNKGEVEAENARQKIINLNKISLDEQKKIKDFLKAASKKQKI